MPASSFFCLFLLVATVTSSFDASVYLSFSSVAFKVCEFLTMFFSLRRLSEGGCVNVTHSLYLLGYI
jgi:hypothetical protein